MRHATKAYTAYPDARDACMIRLARDGLTRHLRFFLQISTVVVWQKGRFEPRRLAAQASTTPTIMVLEHRHIVLIASQYLSPALMLRPQTYDALTLAFLQSPLLIIPATFKS